ncbi:MAG: hypothetical protein IJ087_16405 [Eggerthellaceae bacterium]|nr:hypothetical protein [Eggerthellaceae bacterium]
MAPVVSSDGSVRNLFSPDSGRTQQNTDVTEKQGGNDSASKPEKPLWDVSDLAIGIPELRERREKGGRLADLMSEARPVFKLNGEPLAEALRAGDDYLLAYYRGGNADAPLERKDRLAAITEAGEYRCVVTGVSKKLGGQVAVPFKVMARKRSKKPLAVLAAAAAIAAVAVAVLTFSGNAPWYDPNAGEGLAGIHDSDLQAYLDAKVDEGMMNITVLSKLVFEGGTTTDRNNPGEIGFNNIPGNHVDQKLAITLDDTGEQVYESGAIQPGQNIQYITLTRDLEPGTYEATSTITGYDRDTHAELGTLAAKLRIFVNG